MVIPGWGGTRAVRTPSTRVRRIRGRLLGGGLVRWALPKRCQNDDNEA
jgi:hypothetical protein